MATRLRVTSQAIWEADFGSWKPGAREMEDMFLTAGLAPPTAADLNKFKTASSNVPVFGRPISWCGIFATAVLKRWGGLDVKWVYGRGIVGKGINKTWSYEGMRAGDVAVIRGKGQNGGRLDHFFVITYIDYNRNIMHSVDGNSSGNQIVWHTNKKINYGKDNTYYRPYCHYKLAI